jgi:tetratricopeptide (TPR) repeat protein
VVRADSTERLIELNATATHFHFNDTSEQVLERVVALTNEAVEKLQARLEVANFRESRKDLTGAQSELNSVLRDNPAVLGVIRANVDFYDRTKELPRTVTVLEDAADRAVAPYKKDLLNEAAAKATEAGDYTEARKILDQLLKDDPYDGDLLAAKANTYSQQGDSEALAAFYQQTLATMSQAPLPSQDKQTRIGGLRRGYVLALTKLGRYHEGLDQYIEVLNR